MRKSDDLLDINEVCSYFGLSEATVRRRIKESRDGMGNFPLPLFKSGHRLLWKKHIIEGWGGEDADVITFVPDQIPQQMPQLVQDQNLIEVRKRLEKEFNIPLNN